MRPGGAPAFGSTQPYRSGSPNTLTREQLTREPERSPPRAHVPARSRSQRVSGSRPLKPVPGAAYPFHRGTKLGPPGRARDQHAGFQGPSQRLSPRAPVPASDATCCPLPHRQERDPPACVAFPARRPGLEGDPPDGGGRDRERDPPVAGRGERPPWGSHDREGEAPGRSEPRAGRGRGPMGGVRPPGPGERSRLRCCRSGTGRPGVGFRRPEDPEDRSRALRVDPP